MVQIIKEREHRPSVAERLLGAVSGGIQAFGQYKQGQRQAEALRSAGVDPSLPPELQKVALQEMLKGQNKVNAQQKKMSLLENIFGGRGQQGQQMQRPQEQGMQDQQEFPEGSLQQQLGFDPAELSPQDIAMASAVDPQFGAMLQRMNDVALREKRAAQELQFKQMKESPEHRRELQLESSQAQADVKYNQELQQASKQHELKQQTLDRLETLNKKGVTGKPYEKLLERSGLINLTSEGRREFAADVKNLITDIRSILGGQFSNFEFQTILNAYPSADFSKEANAAIIKNLKGFQDIKNKEVEFAEQLKKQNKGKIPLDFQAQVNQKVRDYAATKVPEIRANTLKILNEEHGIKPGFVLMFDPQGEPLNVPESEVERYESFGATFP